MGFICIDSRYWSNRLPRELEVEHRKGASKCGFCAPAGIIHEQPVRMTFSQANVPQRRRMSRLNLSLLVAKDIGVTSIQDSHGGASEQFTAGGTKFDLY